MEIMLEQHGKALVLVLEGQGSIENGMAAIENLRKVLSGTEVELDLRGIQGYDLPFLQIILSFINTFSMDEKRSLCIMDSEDQALLKAWRDYGLEEELLRRYLNTSGVSNGS